MHALVLSILLAGQADEPVFHATSSSADSSKGHVIRLTGRFAATLRTKSGDTIVRDVISLRRFDRPIPGFPTAAHLVTTAGDLIVGSLAGGDGQFLRFQPSGAGLKPDTVWKVPLSSAVVLWLTDTPANTPLDASSYDWLADVKHQDVLRFRNGDIARGSIDGVDPTAETPVFPFRPTNGDQRSVAASELAAIAFNPALARARKPKGAYVRVVLTDGSRLALTNSAISDGVLTGTTLFGEKVELRLTGIVAVDVIGGKAMYLSDLKPTKVEQAAFLGVTWSWGADRTVRGEALRVMTALGESIADKGLSTHPRTTLTYDLGGKYQRFEALVGLDPSAAIRSKVSVRVLVDGKEQTLPALQALSDGKAVEVRVDVRGAKELVLVTDFGPAGGVGGDVNWADARLIE
jgi:NPCBM/NEW2 domain